jgi:ribonucleoside-diphosphate reductase beta chain
MTAPAFLDQRSLPLRDYHKAKKLAWDPQAIDWTQDQADWARLSDRERSLLTQAVALFLGGEESVTHDLAPLLIALRRGGGTLEDEMFVASQLFDEARHVELFDAVSRHVFGHPADAAAVAGPSYRALFAELTAALDALLADHSLAAQARAVASYHMIIEGVLAETGYHGIFTALGKRGLMPGLRRGLEYVQRDEARHIAFGLHLLGRAIKTEPALWESINERMDELLPLSHGVFLELIDPWLPDIPFDLDLGALLDYASGQFGARLAALERALPKG